MTVQTSVILTDLCGHCAVTPNALTKPTREHLCTICRHIESVSDPDLNAILQMRDAVLDEVLAAVHLLMDSQLFSCGMAAAISSHIRPHLGPNFSWQEFGDRVYLEHASLLDLEPLQELLTFLWTQLGLKAHLLDPYIKAQQLLRHQVSYLELQAWWWPCILL